MLRFALVLRLAPFARDPPLVPEAIQRRIERALLNSPNLLFKLLNAQQYAVPVRGPSETALRISVARHCEAAVSGGPWGLHKLGISIHPRMAPKARSYCHLDL